MKYKIIATFFGLGYAPKAPGTFGSIGGIFSYFLLASTNITPLSLNTILGVMITVFFILGVISCNKLSQEWGKDPSKIVVDEAVGQWIPLLFIPFNYIYIILAFILFRFFDISKILFIKKAENLPGGLGVMMDDVLAGVYSLVVLQIIIKFAPF